MLDADRRAVVEQDRLAASDLGRDVGGGREVAHDLQVRGGIGEECLVEPRQVLAHQSPGQEVGGEDRLARGTDPALVADPAVPLLDGPLVQSHGVRRVLVAVGRRVERQLTTGVVEHEVVGLLHGVDPATELAGLDDVQPDGGRGPPRPAHRPLQHAQPP